jgi:putative MFS transporter
MLLACGLWMCWNFAYFGLLLWLPALLTQYKGVEGSAVFSYVMSFTAAGIAGRLAMAGILDRLGRRRSLVLASAGAGFCLVLLSASSDPSMLLLLLVATAFFLDSGHSAIFAYTPELFSTAVRSSGIGWAAAAGRVASTAAPIVVGAVVAEGVSFVFVMFAVSTVAAGVLILLTGTETKGTSLDALSPTAADQLHFSRQQLEAP